MKRLRLRETFYSEEQEIENKAHTSLAKVNSSFHWPRNESACLDKTIDFLQQQTFQSSL